MALSTRSTSRPTVDVTRARQGRAGRNMLWVLIAALVLVVLGFLITYAFHAPHLSNAPGPRPPREVASTFNAPQPGAAARPNYQTGGALAPQNHGNPGQPEQRSKTAEP
jgi:hypothetical protein